MANGEVRRHATGASAALGLELAFWRVPFERREQW
jgi:hypothetical protein